MKKYTKTQIKKKPSRTISGIIFLNSRGVGFIEDPKSKKDIRIENNAINKALDRDEVNVEIIKNIRGQIFGRVIKILKRHKNEYIGTIDSKINQIFPDDKKFYTPVKYDGKYDDGQKVIFKIISWENSSLPKAKVIKVIGKKGEHETEIQAIYLSRGIESDFPLEVLKEAEVIKNNYENDFKNEESKIKTNNRLDLRDRLTFTIDPETAKDFDDAISLKQNFDGSIEVGIHIADVSHFVRPHTNLDREASKRQFSTYLVDRTIPMLPETLSNDLCSLNPNEDRLAFSNLFTFKDNKIIKRVFSKSIIRSKKRFTYENAQNTIDEGGEYSRELKILNDLAKKLRDEKFKAGAIDFEQDEISFILDEKKKPIQIVKKQRLDTHKLVEEFMLLANKESAKHIYEIEKRRGIKTGLLYRIHDLPDREKIKDLSALVRALGYELTHAQGKVKALDLQALMNEVSGKAEEGLIKTAAVRSMSKAIYSTENIGHFGLAFEYYAHFTSPIRRYPDLLVHRILEKVIGSKTISSGEISFFEKNAKLASEREIGIAEAERESIKYKMVEFMNERIGYTFEGIVTGVTDWGIYLEDPQTKAEGMIRISEIGDDYYDLDEKMYRIVGRRTKKIISLGDKIKVKIKSVDIERKSIDLIIA